MTEKVLQNQAKVGFIATGDELTQGDILNTNGQIMAQTLHEIGFLVNQHIIIDDNEANISAAIQFQAQNHDIIILSGGLGPTSDDRTRFALAKALNLELDFDEAAWETIKRRLNSANLATDNHNRQQALFPRGATILPNSHGSAAACYIEHEGVCYFMLPGPPSECLPIFQQQVIPLLQSKAQPHHHFKWLLMGASEGDIAAKLDDALSTLNCCTGYRWAYPYLEFKVYADNKTTLQQAEEIVEPLLQTFLVSKHSLDYQQQLLNWLHNSHYQLHFAQTPLSQYVQAAILSNQTQHYISHESTANSIHITVAGLKEYWQQSQPPLQTMVKITLQKDDKTWQTEQAVYYRDQHVFKYLLAVVCKQVLAFSAEL